MEETKSLTPKKGKKEQTLANFHSVNTEARNNTSARDEFAKYLQDQKLKALNTIKKRLKYL